MVGLEGWTGKSIPNDAGRQAARQPPALCHAVKAVLGRAWECKQRGRDPEAINGSAVRKLRSTQPGGQGKGRRWLAVSGHGGVQGSDSAVGCKPVTFGIQGQLQRAAAFGGSEATAGTSVGGWGPLVQVPTRPVQAWIHIPGEPCATPLPVVSIPCFTDCYPHPTPRSPTVYHLTYHRCNPTP